MPKHYKEITSTRPDQEHPLTFKLKDICDDLTPDTEIQVYLEWHEGTYGTKVPCVVVKPKI